MLFWKNILYTRKVTITKKGSMKTTAFVLILSLSLFTTSCSQEQTIQEYILESQNKEHFKMFSVPIGFFKPMISKESIEIQKTAESVRKITLLLLPYEDHEEIYQTEKDKLVQIFKNTDKYKSVMRTNLEGVKMKIYLTGSTDAVNEIIVFGYTKDEGLGLARILGDHMDLAKIIDTINLIASGDNQFNFETLINLAP